MSVKHLFAFNVTLEIIMLGALVHAHSAVGISAWVCYQTVGAYRGIHFARHARQNRTQT